MTRSCALALLLAGTACGLLSEPKPDVAAANHFADQGLAFDYPGNWKFESETETADGVDTLVVTVESSGSGIAMVQQYKPAVHVSPDEMLEVVTAEMRKATGEQLGGAVGFSGGGVSSGTRVMLGAERPTRRTQFSLTLLNENVPHTLELVMADLDDRTVVVMLQAANEDLETVMPAFEQIVGSVAVPAR